MRSILALTALLCLFSVNISLAQQARGVVYDFGAQWCGPCQQVAPIVEKLQREGLPIQKVDIDREPALKEKFGVQQIPTFVLVIDGQEVDRVTGRLTEADLRRMVARIPAAQPHVAKAPGQRNNGSNMSIPIELGEAVPMTRPAPMATEPPPVRTAENEQRRGIRDLIPFGRKEQSEPEVVRGNDSALTSNSTTPASTMESASNGEADPMKSSVRIRVVTNGRIDLGSGTIISSKPGLTRILTCAHIFKEFNEDSRIEVDVFERGTVTPYTASLVKYDAESDLGLITIPTTSALPTIKVPGPEGAPRVGEPVAAIGCSGGEEPTRQQSRVTDVDKFEGPHNLMCVGVPVRGRSGGGLFNQKGEIVGVCSAADEQEQRGFYSGLLAIHKLLDDCQLTALYAPPTPPQERSIPATRMAESEPFSNRDFPAASPRETAGDMLAATSGNRATPPTAGRSTPSTPVDVQAGDAEVVVIIRDHKNPGAANRVVILHQASPKFMAYLSGELNEGGMSMDMLGNAQSPSPFGFDSTSNSPQLRPTGLSQPVVPQRYTRSSNAR